MDPTSPDILEYTRARFTARLPRAYLYTRSHFWIDLAEGSFFRIGLTKFASRMLGEMVDYGFELESGAAVNSGQVIGWIEGFKAISDLVCIADGQFAGPNPALESNITLVNHDPCGAGWLYAVNGTPDPTCVDVQAYAAILDQTIDKLLQEQNP
jgi:glycine cleavage system H protein